MLVEARFGVFTSSVPRRPNAFLEFSSDSDSPSTLQKSDSWARDADLSVSPWLPEPRLARILDNDPHWHQKDWISSQPLGQQSVPLASPSATPYQEQAGPGRDHAAATRLGWESGYLLGIYSKCMCPDRACSPRHHRDSGTQLGHFPGLQQPDANTSDLQSHCQSLKKRIKVFLKEWELPACKWVRKITTASIFFYWNICFLPQYHSTNPSKGELLNWKIIVKWSTHLWLWRLGGEMRPIHKRMLLFLEKVNHSVDVSGLWYWARFSRSDWEGSSTAGKENHHHSPGISNSPDMGPLLTASRGLFLFHPGNIWQTPHKRTEE